MRLIKMFFFVLPSFLAANTISPTDGRASVLVCYGRLNPSDIKGYGFVILEPQYYNAAEIRTIKSQNEKVVAYISVGEVNANAVHFPLLKNETLGKNKIWNSYYLNLDSEKTVKVIMDLIADGLQKGYDGFFLDNLDNFTIHGPQFRQKQALLKLIRNIYQLYPEKTFIQNAGLEMIADTAPFIDALLIESIASDYSFAQSDYKLRAETDFQKYVAKLENIKNKHKIPVLLVEYADTSELKKAIEERIMPLGYDYFIGNINLQTIPKFAD